MRQRINIYIGDLVLAELERLANVRGLSRGKVVEELVLGAADTENRLVALEKAIAERGGLLETRGAEPPALQPLQKDRADPPASGPKVKEMRGEDWGA